MNIVMTMVRYFVSICFKANFICKKDLNEVFHDIVSDESDPNIV